MSDATADHATQLAKFNITDSAIVELSELYMPMKIDGVNDRAGFNQVHGARMTMVSKRTDVDKVRKGLKADALAYGRMVDAEAKRITGLLAPIEQHLLEQENAYKAAKQKLIDEAREKAEAEAQAKRDAEAARVKAEQDAENERLRVEREKFEAEKAAAEEKRLAEQAKLDAEREEMEAKQREAEEKHAAAMKAAQDKLDAEAAAIEKSRNDEREKLAAEQAKVEDEKKRLAAIEAERVRAEELEKAKAEAAEKAQREEKARIEREAAEKEAQAKADAAELARQEALKPDKEKLLLVAQAVAEIEVPSVSPAAADAVASVETLLKVCSGGITAIANSL